MACPKASSESDTSQKPPSSPPVLPDKATTQLVHEGRVMRSIVRNMVVNMETVLTDLQDIMGDIKTLVVQIDSVTNKIDQQCTAEGRRGSDHVVHKPQCIRSPKPNSGQDMSSVPSYDQVKSPSEAQSAHVSPYFQRLQKQFVSGAKKGGQYSPEYLEPRVVIPESSGQSHVGKFHSFKSRFDGKPQTSSKHGDCRKSWPVQSEISLSSRGHLRDYGLPATNRGACVAIVRPTPGPALEGVGNSSQQKFARSPRKDKAAALVSHSLQACPEQPFLGTHNKHVYHSPSSVDGIYEEIPTKQLYARTSVVNRAFQPETPTELSSPVTLGGIIQKSHVVRKTTVVGSASEKITTVASPKTSREVRSKLSSCDSLPSSPNLRRTRLNMSGSPQKHLSSLEHQLVPSKDTPLYQSLESDLDSDNMGCDYPEIRSMTPDIDWSYLGLVGNREIRTRQREEEASMAIEHSGRDHCSPSRQLLYQQRALFQNNPGILVRLQSIPSLFSNTSTTAQLPPPTHRLDTIYNSPLMMHVFCSEVTNAGSGSYCGCYEAIVDSVLENIAGFETIEEACDALYNCDEVLNETYINFEDDFQADNWDVGLRSIVHGYGSSPIYLPDFAEDDLFEDNLFKNTSFDDLKSSSEVFHQTANLTPLENSPDIDVGDRNNCKRRLSPSLSEGDSYCTMICYDDVNFPSRSGNSYTDDDYCVLKPSSSPQVANFTLWHRPNYFDKRVDEAGGRGGGDDKHRDQPVSTSSDETSVRAEGSGSSNSVMSFGSPGLVAYSPDTDVFGTSSDADDLFASPGDNILDTLDSPLTYNHKQNIMQLRRDFFDSLFNPSAVPIDTENTSSTEGAAVGVEVNATKNDNANDSASEAGSDNDDATSFNRNVNTWTAYTMVHMNPDDVSDTASDIMNDNSINCSMTSSYFEADNVSVSQPQQGLGY